MVDWKAHWLWGMLSGVKGEEITTICTSFYFRYPTLGFHMTSTKFKARRLSILLSFYFHEVSQQLNIFIYKNVRFERVLDFLIEDA